MCSGAILSDYQRIRVEHVCSRLGLVSLSYLWRRDQADLLDQMVANKVESVLIKTATLGLDQKHLGMTLGQVRNHLHAMNAKVMSLPPRDHSSIDKRLPILHNLSLGLD